MMNKIIQDLNKDFLIICEEDNTLQKKLITDTTFLKNCKNKYFLYVSPDHNIAVYIKVVQDIHLLLKNAGEMNKEIDVLKHMYVDYEIVQSNDVRVMTFLEEQKVQKRIQAFTKLSEKINQLIKSELPDLSFDEIEDLITNVTKNNSDKKKLKM